MVSLVNWFVIALLVLFAISNVALFYDKSRRAKRRYYLLVQNKRVSNWATIAQKPLVFKRIICVNFRFGPETWATPLGADEIDFDLLAFKDGVLIESAPPMSELRQFCQSNDIEFIHRITKW